MRAHQLCQGLIKHVSRQGRMTRAKFFHPMIMNLAAAYADTLVRAVATTRSYITPSFI